MSTMTYDDALEFARRNAWPKSATRAMEPHLLSEFGACLSCNQAAHTVGAGGAVHTATGLFKCEVGKGGSGEAELDPQPAEDAQQILIDEAVNEAVHDAEREVRGEVGMELRTELTKWERKYLGDDDVPGQEAIKAILKGLHDWSTEL